MRAAPRVASGSPSDLAPAGAHVNDAAGPKAHARLVRSADFERVLRARPCALSAHFALHHVPARPSASHGALSAARRSELSTEARPEMVRSVDDLTRTSALDAQTLTPGSAPGAWLGCVVPKRHARRAVTRTLFKRQIRSVAAAAPLSSGLWVVRLRASFDRANFPSAASEALARAARGELETLLAQGAKRARAAPLTAV